MTAEPSTGARPIEMVAELRPRTGRADYVFPGDTLDKPLGDISGFWERLREEICIPDVRLHDLRHQFASILASAGMSLPVIGRLLGHTQPITTARYAHLFDDPLRAATEQVADAIKKSNVHNHGGG